MGAIMQRIHTFTFGLLFAAALLMQGCSKEEPPPPKAQAPAAPQEVVVKIGSASPITGPQAHIGVDIRNGVQLAIDDINASGLAIDGKKVKLELVAEDDE